MPKPTVILIELDNFEQEHDYHEPEDDTYWGNDTADKDDENCTACGNAVSGDCYRAADDVTIMHPECCTIVGLCDLVEAWRHKHEPDGCSYTDCIHYKATEEEDELSWAEMMEAIEHVLQDRLYTAEEQCGMIDHHIRQHKIKGTIDFTTMMEEINYILDNQAQSQASHAQTKQLVWGRIKWHVVRE